MRFVGLVLVLVGLAVAYFLSYRGLTIDQARTRLAQLLNIPGLKPSSSSSSSTSSTPPTTAGGSGLSGLTNPGAGQGVAGGGGGSW